MLQPFSQTGLSNLPQYSSYKFPSQIDIRDVSLIIDRSEKQFLSYLVDMFSVLKSDKIDLNKFNDIIDLLMELKKTQELDYYKCLLRPEKSKGCKIPSQLPIPSCSFQLKHSINISTNASGNLAFVFVPFYLGTTGSTTGGTFFLNNNVGLTGSASSNFFISTDIGQLIPPVYSSYRLVSSSVIVKYIGKLEAAQGTIGGAIVFEGNVGHANYGVTSSNLAKYGDFNLARDAFFNQEHHILNGIREIFFPIDISYEYYSRLNTTREGFAQYVYILGGPASSTVAKVDIYSNFECLPDASFLNYIPVTSSPYLDTNSKEKIIMQVQKDPIMKETAPVAGETPAEKSIFEKIIDTVGGVIPSIVDIATLIGKFI